MSNWLVTNTQKQNSAAIKMNEIVLKTTEDLVAPDVSRYHRAEFLISE